MEQILLSTLENFGLPITFLGIMIFLFLKMLDQHKKERGEWRLDAKEGRSLQIDAQKETSEVIRQLTLAISSIQRK